MSAQTKPVVYASIVPLKSFVSAIAGDDFEVKVMVGQGQSPETYEPKPDQISAISTTKLFFRIGVPFEMAWIEKLKKLNPNMRVVDLREGIKVERSHDPHLWTSPKLMMIMSQSILNALSQLKPEAKSAYEKRYNTLSDELKELDEEISVKLAPHKKKRFMVFHPAWGYFADSYEVVQLAIEGEGKEAGPKGLMEMIDKGKALGIKHIFIQKQFSDMHAQTIARELGAEILQADPLAEDYFTALRDFTDQLVKVLK